MVSRSLDDQQLVLSKSALGAVLLEAQDFIGEDDGQLLASAYGLVGGGGDAIVVDLDTGGFRATAAPTGGYEEWEGVGRNGTVAFMEVDPDAELTPGRIDLYLYQFDTEEFVHLTSVEPGELHAPQQSHEPVFDETGNWALTTTGAYRGWPGMGAGIALWDLSGTD